MIQHHVPKLQEREKTEQKYLRQGERNDAGEKPRVLLIKKISERYKKLKHLRQESQKHGDI
jgi:hypothetical protein